MRKLFLLLILAIGLAGMPVSLTADEIMMPMRVEGPRLSKTVFTNWDLIEIIYTLGYYEGYEPIFDEIKPENMNFGPLEIDPGHNDKLIRINERKFRKETFVDVVYYVRYIGEKKEELKIRSQNFPYQRITSAKGMIQALSPVKSNEFLVRYDSVLTSNADDIKDDIDFGSFRFLATLWKSGAVGGFLVVGALILWVVFHQPKIDVSMLATNKEQMAKAGGPVPLTLQEAYAGLAAAVKNGDIKSICNCGKEVVLRYVPGATKAMSYDQIKSLADKIAEPILHRRLNILCNCLNGLEECLYDAQSSSFDQSPELRATHLGRFAAALSATLPDLDPHRVASRNYWLKIRKKLFLDKFKGWL